MRVYISNGTMGELWMERNCNGCSKDHRWHAHEDAEGQCPILNALYCDEYPIEGLVEHPLAPWPDALECTRFTSCECSR